MDSSTLDNQVIKFPSHGKKDEVSLFLSSLKPYRDMSGRIRDERENVRYNVLVLSMMIKGSPDEYSEDIIEDVKKEILRSQKLIKHMVDLQENLDKYVRKFKDEFIVGDQT